MLVEEHEDYNLDYSDDSGSEPDVESENIYYKTKSTKLKKPYHVVVKSFEKILKLESERKQEGIWGFKALKQIIKVYVAMGKYDRIEIWYAKLLPYINKKLVTRNQSEKAILSILDLLSDCQNIKLQLKICMNTLRAIRGTKRHRLWFRTKCKLGQVYADIKDFSKLARIVTQLYMAQKGKDEECIEQNDYELLNIYALQIQLYNHKKKDHELWQLYDKFIAIKTTNPHSIITGLVRECMGHMYIRQDCTNYARLEFFRAIVCFHEAYCEHRVKKYLTFDWRLLEHEQNLRVQRRSCFVQVYNNLQAYLRNS